MLRVVFHPSSPIRTSDPGYHCIIGLQGYGDWRKKLLLFTAFSDFEYNQETSILLIMQTLELAFLLLVFAVLKAAATPPEIVDLSLPQFALSPVLNNNQGATEVLELATSTPEIRTILVLEQGKVVAEYVRHDVNPSTPNLVHSVTKSWMGLAIGMMVQDGVLDVDETLGDIFNDPNLWQGMRDRDIRQAVTVKELLTMTSGMETNRANGGGGSLFESLEGPPIKGDKELAYLAVNNILSYVVPARTTYATPREYMANKVFPALGVSNDEIEWQVNQEGLEFAFTGLHLTPIQMAKFGQLYLQRGKPSSTNQVVVDIWVSDSTSQQAAGGYGGFDGIYGYLWWVEMGEVLGYSDLGNVACAVGLGWQQICVSPLTNRVFILQSDVTDRSLHQLSPLGLLPLVPSLVFDPANKPGTGQAMGDPHFQDSGGNWYDFHGQCDLVYLENYDFGSGAGLSIHIRTSARYAYSYIETCAIMIGEDILEISSWGEYFFNGIDNGLDASEVRLAHHYYVNHTQLDTKTHHFELDLVDEQKIIVTTHKDMVSVKIVGVKYEEFKNSTGLLGKMGTGEHLGRNGTIIEDNRAFGQEWQVLSSEPMLFQSSRHPQHPIRCLMPDPNSETSRVD